MGKPVKPYAAALPVLTLKTTSGQDSSAKERAMPKERRKQGNPFKRGKTWTFVYYVIDPATGKRKQKWKGGYRTKKEASEALAIVKGELAKGTHVESSKITFREYAQQFMKLQSHTLRPSTIKKYCTLLKHYTGLIDHKALKDITVDDIIAIDEEMRGKGLCENSITNYHTHIKAIFNFAVRQDDLPRSPYKKFTVPQKQKHKIELPSIEVFQDILTKAEEYNDDLYGILLMALTLGLRRGEIAGLQYGDFDFEAHTVHIQRQIAAYMPASERGAANLKTTSSDRIIGVPQITMAYIEEHIEDANGDLSAYVFGQEGKCTDPYHIAYLYKTFKRKCDVPDIRLHDFRHAYASICLEQGVDLKVISDMLGHADISTTANIYCETNRMRHVTANVMDSVLD